LPVEELKSLITNGGLDILLAGVGYASVKLAPKFAKLGDDALKLTDDVARKFDDAYQATKGKVAELANKVDDALSPGMVTTEGIVIKPKQIKGSNVLEMRANKTTSGNRRFEEAMRQKHLPEGTAKVLSGDELTQAAKITNRPAADQIAFVKNGKGVDAVITEITQGNKGLTHLKEQLEGGRMIAQSDKEFGHKITDYNYRVITNNQKLADKIKTDLSFQKRFKGKLEVIFEGGKKMIKIIDKPPIKFEKIVKKTIENNLSDYDFEGDFPSGSDQNENVTYSRKRKGIEEQIKFFRRDYFDNYKEEVDDEVEKKPYYFSDNSGFVWISRHWFEILIISHYGHRNLLTTGKVEVGRNGEEYWYFENEEDLQRLLKEKIVLLLQTVVIDDFDERLEDELKYSSERKIVKSIQIPPPSQIAFVKKENGYEAVISEITEENVELNYLKRILEGGKEIAEADEEYGHLVSKFTYRVITNNSQLVKAIEIHPILKEEIPDLMVIFEDEWK